MLTGADYYSGTDIQYLGVEADDKPSFNISHYFCPVAQFIHEALSHAQSKSWRKLKSLIQTILENLYASLLFVYN